MNRRRNVLFSVLGVLAIGVLTAAAGPFVISAAPPAQKIAEAPKEKLEPTRRVLTPEEQRYLDAEIARHDFAAVAPDRYLAAVNAIELLNETFYPEPVKDQMAARLAAMNPAPFTVRESVDQRPANQVANQPRTGTRAPLQRFPLRAGAAWSSIVMPIGVPLPGFGRFPPQADPAADPYDYATIYASNEGMRDVIRAKAVVLESNGELFCVLGLDTVGVMGEIRDAIVVEVNNRGIPLNGDNFIASATHTHSGPGALTTIPFWQAATADIFDQRVFDLMIERVADAIENAHGNLESAALGYAIQNQPNLDVQENRRNDPTKVDRDLGVIRIDRTSDGSPIAVLFNLGFHPICFSSSNVYFSADLSGFAERSIEAALGGDALAVHINDAQGDISITQKGLTGARNLGQALAQAVLAVHGTVTTSGQVGITADTVEQLFPPPYLRIGLLEDSLPLNWTIPMTGLIPDRADYTALRINDDFVMVTVPGEPITEIGLDIKAGARALGFTNVMVAACAQDHLSYFVTETEYWQGGYEAGACVFGPESGQVVTGHALDVVDNIAP